MDYLLQKILGHCAQVKTGLATRAPHSTAPNFMIQVVANLLLTNRARDFQGGDFTSGDGTGGKSIYGRNLLMKIFS